MSAAAKPTLAAEVVTKAEILALAKCEKAHAEAQRAATLAENEVKAQRMALVEKVLGLASDELKQLAPDEVQRLYLLRLQKHLWTFQKGTPMFTFEESSHGRYPKWKDLFADEVGEAAAAQAQNETSITYSYRVKVEE